jgi:Protein of unknown function (DUF4245)
MSEVKPAPVVAELGRPETAEETAARKALNSKLHRTRQTTRNLVLATVATLALAAAIIALSPTAPAQVKANTNYRALATQGEVSTAQPLLAPDLPSTWKSNSATLKKSDGVQSWTVGFITPVTSYLGFSEGIDANSTWLSDTLDSAKGTATTTAGGLTWRVYDRRSLGGDAGNVAYALATEIGTTYIAVYGTATPALTKQFAAKVAASASAKGLSGAHSTPAAG